jgi:hypothetical protein
MAITRADLLKQILPGLNALFGIEYDIDKIRLDAEQHTVEVDFDGTKDIRRNDNKDK